MKYLNIISKNYKTVIIVRINHTLKYSKLMNI